MKRALLFVGVFCFMLSGFAQNDKCATMSQWEATKLKDPQAQERMDALEEATARWIEDNASNENTQRAGGNYVIPTVVHVVYHTAEENVSDAQINSQLEILNEDFRLMNSDSLPEDHPFWFYSVNAGIEFCLAQQDPNGVATSGITRTYTDVTLFDSDLSDPNVKYTAQGGKNNWDPTKYLNLWVCNLDAETLGYAAFPSDLAASPGDDGVVFHFRAFGTTGTAGTGNFTVNNLGRTGTHEVGHWLNLRHIWGDDTCGDDMVADTPPQSEANYGCPNFPHNANNSCGADSNGEMYMNYMDYVDDNCMNMFSYGQAERMWAALDGPRSGLFESNGCELGTSIEDVDLSTQVSIFPNPSESVFNIQNDSKNQLSNIEVFNNLGMMVYAKNVNLNPSSIHSLDLAGATQGVYHLRLYFGDKLVHKRIVLNK